MEKLLEGKRKWILIAGIIILILLGIIIGCMWKWSSKPVGNTIISKTPMLIVETPQKISLSQDDIFVLDVQITELGEALYPAASMSISFNASHIEFMGVREGNVFVRQNSSDTQMTQKLPEWSCDIERCNESGQINIMYLDITGGKNAFSRELLAEDDNVVVRLAFRLRGSAKVGDIYDLIVEDAVFAASDETHSLSTIQNTLMHKDGKIVVGE